MHTSIVPRSKHKSAKELNTINQASTKSTGEVYDWPLMPFSEYKQTKQHLSLQNFLR